MREGVERVVAKLTERPGVGPLLLLHEQEHGASMLKALRPDRRPSKGPPAPRLLAQPAIKLGMLNQLGRKSHVLSDIADEIGASRSALKNQSLFNHEAEDEEEDDEHEENTFGMSHESHGADGAPGAGGMPGPHESLAPIRPHTQPHMQQHAGPRQARWPCGRLRSLPQAVLQALRTGCTKMLHSWL